MQRFSKTIVCTVTNDLSQDQRMNRICTTLANEGYHVVLIGILRKNSNPLSEKLYKQIRIKGIPAEGKLMYLIYWTKLFFRLMTIKADAFCAIDLDTILPVYWASKIRNKKRIYDAHEIFTELKEVVTRPYIRKLWNVIANYTIPKFEFGYTIGNYYANFFKEKYGVQYEVVRNATVLQNKQLPEYNTLEPYILYQGTVNEGRCFEELIPAMQYVNCRLIICGKGNFYDKLLASIKQYNLNNKVLVLGFIEPSELIKITQDATIGITLFDANNVLSNYYSMANRFFDYMHQGIPQLCNAYPEYIKVNEQFEIAKLIPDTSVNTIANALNEMLENQQQLLNMRNAALEARRIYCWQEEAVRLLDVYKKVFQKNS